MTLKTNNAISQTLILRALYLIIFFLIGCSQTYSPVQTAGVSRVEYPLISDKDVQVPKKLIKDIESIYLKSLKKQDQNIDVTDVKLLMSIPRKYMSLTAYFTPSENKLAFDQPIEIIFSRGGGNVDLSKVVTGNSGGFYLNMLVDWEELGFKKSETNEFQAFFISNSKKRTLNNEFWGSGCGKYYNITDMFHNNLSKSGLLLNATDARYLSLLAGTFVFVIVKDKDLFLATVSLSDSRYTDWLCRS